MTIESYGVLSPSFARPQQARRSSLSSVPVSPPRPEPAMTPSGSLRVALKKSANPVQSEISIRVNKYCSDDIIREILTGEYKEPEHRSTPQKRSSTSGAVSKSPAPQVRKASESPSPVPPKRQKIAFTVLSSDETIEDAPVRRNPGRVNDARAVLSPMKTLTRTAIRPRQAAAPKQTTSKTKPANAAPKRK